jgi:hypothetical protein
MIATYGNSDSRWTTQPSAGYPGRSEELAGGVLMYVEEKRRRDNEGVRLKANCR